VVKTTYDLSQVHASLGMRGQRALPNVDPTRLDQVIVVGDMSQSFGAQAFEARAIASITKFTLPAVYGIAQVFSQAPGGIVVERVDLFAIRQPGGAPARSLDMRVGVPTDTVSEQPTANIQNVGGSAIVSRVVAADILGGGSLPANTFVRAILDDSGLKTFENFGWFIQGGQVFEVAANNDDADIQVNVQWREIPQAPGSQ